MPGPGQVLGDGDAQILGLLRGGQLMTSEDVGCLEALPVPGDVHDEAFRGVELYLPGLLPRSQTVKIFQKFYLVLRRSGPNFYLSKIVS